MVFKDAKKDEACKTAYKHLAEMHSCCAEIGETITATASILGEIRDFEHQIEVSSGKNMSENLAKITYDLEALKKENAGLKVQIKAKSK